MDKDKEVNRDLRVTFRLVQAIFFGILALGISSFVGDILEYAKSPISTFSTTTTIFGLIGAIVTGILADKCKDW